MKKVIVLAAAIAAIFPVFTNAETSGFTDVGNFLAGQVCRVTIFHTDFAFPPEGGEIGQAPDGQLFFVKTYAPGCETAAAGLTIIPTTPANAPPTRFPPNPTPVPTCPN